MNSEITKVFTLLIILLLLQLDVYSQCPTSIHINNQQDVDNFSIDYPECANQGWVTNITISGSDITDLSGLRDIVNVKSVLTWEKGNVRTFSTWNSLDSITKIRVLETDSTLTSFEGLEDVTNTIDFESYAPKINNLSALTNCNLRLFYFSSDSISTISGFNSITKMNMISIDNCPNLVSITGFQNLEDITTHLWLRWNNSLSDISGFQSLRQISNTLYIQYGQLNDFNDFSSLKLVGSTLLFENLPNLTDISILNQTDFLGSVQFKNNSELETCCVIKNLLRNGIIRNLGPIENNKTNCNNLFEIFNFCQDSDSDGIEDFNDNCVNSPNQTQSDYDNDGIGDGCDNCPLISNSNQNDMDGNGIGDACDNGINNTVQIQMGDLYIDSNVNGIILKSINGSCYRLIINDEGKLETYTFPCP